MVFQSDFKSKLIMNCELHTCTHTFTFACLPSLLVMKNWAVLRQAHPPRVHPGNITHFPAHCWGSFSKVSSRPSSISLLRRPISWEEPGCPDLLWVSLHHTLDSSGNKWEMTRGYSDVSLFVGSVAFFFFLAILDNEGNEHCFCSWWKLKSWNL